MRDQRRLLTGLSAVLLTVGLVGVVTMLAPPGMAVEPASRANEPPRIVRPAPGAVLRAFNPPASRYGAGHRGVDLDVAPGEPVVAAMDGIVSFAGTVADTSWVTVDHGGGLDTTYGGLTPRLVSAGMRVRAGQVLGHLSDEATHLDWGARHSGEYLDPLSLLGRWRVRLAPLS